MPSTLASEANLGYLAESQIGGEIRERGVERKQETIEEAMVWIDGPLRAPKALG